MKKEIEEFENIVKDLYMISESPCFDDEMRNKAGNLQYYINRNSKPATTFKASDINSSIKDVDNDWKDLDITSTIELLDENKTEIQIMVSSEWVEAKGNLGVIVNDLIYGAKYRYRLKPLESIRITREIFDIINDSHCTSLDNNIKYGGRKVEIIE